MPSNTFHWKDIAELIGISAIVASLIFVGLQMRQAQDIAISDGNLANAANKIEANNLLAANPPYGSYSAAPDASAAAAASPSLEASVAASSPCSARRPGFSP